MAIKKTVTTVFGIEVVDAYHRVEAVQISGKTEITYHIRSYKDKSGVPFFEEKVAQAPYDIAGSNPIAQAYDHAKSLPEFAGSVDC